MPLIRDASHDLVPRTSQQLIQRADNCLSSQPKTAGSVVVNWTIHNVRESHMVIEEGSRNASSLYSLAQDYVGEVNRHIESFDKDSRGRLNIGRRISAPWMRGVKACFVCGKPNCSNDRHSHDEVTAAVRKRNAKQLTALITVEDLA